MDDLISLLGGGLALTGLFSIVIGACFIIVPGVIVVAVFYFLRQGAKKMEAANLAAQSWFTTTGTVILSRVEVSGGENTTVSPHVRYEYQVGGVTYRNDQLKAGWGTTVSQYGGAYDVIDHYPEGSTVTVYFNPAFPADSALER